jgi:hypothetical protein
MRKLILVLSLMAFGACSDEASEEVDNLSRADTCDWPDCGDPPDNPDDFVMCYIDRDHDGRGDVRYKRKYIAACPPGRTLDNSDCDDSNPNFWAYFYQVDRDHDGHGAPGPSNRVASCNPSPPAGTVSNDDDCDDGRSEVFPRTCKVDDDGDGIWTEATRCTATCPELPKPTIHIGASPALPRVGEPVTFNWQVTAPPRCRLRIGWIQAENGYEDTGVIHGILVSLDSPPATGSYTVTPTMTDLHIAVNAWCDTAAGLFGHLRVKLSQAVTATTLTYLMPQTVWEGFVPFATTFTLYGNNATGHVTQIQNYSPWTLSFVKPGHGTSECGDPSAVVVAPSMGYVDLERLYGSSSVGLPLGIVACRSYDASPIGPVPISITYTYID